MKKLHLDIETYSSVDIKSSGAYKYTESIDFEILLVAYAFDNEPIKIVDLAQGDLLPDEVIEALYDENIEKHAHNATFERQSFKQYGFDIPINQWYCSAVKAAYCGLPLSLDMVSKALKLEEKGKLATGKALIKYFCIPCKPSKVNGLRTRNYPHNDLEKWEEFKKYCINDVEAEREIDRRLEAYIIPEFERENYILDQEINDRGVKIDLVMAKNACLIDDQFSEFVIERVKRLTNLENPNSAAQLKKWIGDAIGKEVPSLAKTAIPELLKLTDASAVLDIIDCRQKLARTSTKKYASMLNCACADKRAHGLFQFYGANRTGRWAGRLIQLQNLRQNHIPNINLAREVIASGDYDLTTLLYDDIPDLLSQLIRTALIPRENTTFAVADFSAIEARVVAWLADEKWRLEVFKTHGKIYEASAAMMFNLPIESIKKGSDLRQKGKIAELALGYGGALGALKKMGGEQMGLSEPEMNEIVGKWRAKNLAIVAFWKAMENAAKQAVKTKRPVITKYKNIIFDSNSEVLTIQLPSGRKLFYQEPRLKPGNFNSEVIEYKGMEQTTKTWLYLDTYGGKLVENIVQAVSRDLLALSMLKLKAADFNIVMHVHDEAVCEVAVDTAETDLKKMCAIMGEPIPWAPGLLLTADGYVTPFYKKD
jgi:DNA polymerase